MKALNIAIAGAGPAGLAAALYLHRAGHAVTIFERFDQPRPLGSGLILQPTGLTVLHDLGLLEAITSLGARIERLHGTDARSGRTVLEVRYDALKGGRFGLAVHRAALFGVLHEAVERAGIAIETNAEIADWDGAQLVGRGGRHLGGYELVVDASGARSPLRARSDVPDEPRPLVYGAFWASLDWVAEGFQADALTQRYDKASVMVGVLPIGRIEAGGPRKAAFFWSLKPDDAAAVKLQGLDALKARIVSLWPACAAYVDQIISFDDLTLARYGHHTLTRPIGRRMAIIGDAAHSTSPQLGQGANMALLDARALAYALETSGDIEAALETYAAARRWHVRVFQALSWMFTPFYQSDSTLLPLLRDRLVATVARVPPAPQILASMVAGTLVDPFNHIGLEELDWSSLRPDEL
jgi:2-polyprenyl-6-methoxyphenol hydroxylase-like FAD-dependent oxidoreductase